jgi:phospholipid/cholesterol/gamma-HCH transport system substrate-binding protein
MATALKVGIFATLCLVVLALLIWNIEDLNPFGSEGQRLAAVFDSVAGLDDKAAVRVAGVRVGRVDGVGLDGRRARVGLLLDKPLPLTEGTTARIANLGLLGDKYVELIPGPPGAPPLPPGAVLPGSTPPSFDDAMAQLNEIGTSIQQVTGSLSGSLEGGGIDRLLSSLEATSEEIRALVAENRQHVASTVRNFDAASATLARELPILSAEMQRAVSQIAMLVEANRGNVDASLANVRTLTEKLQTSVDNLNQISGKIASGEGTIGKLVNSEEGYNEVIATLDSIQGGVESISGTIGAIRKFKLDLDLHGYLLEDRGLAGDDTLSAFAVTIDPQDGKRLYRAGISSTPDGDVKTKTQVITTTLPDGTTETQTIETVTTESDRVLTGLFGYHTPQDNLRLWAGLIESSGGTQVEYQPPLLNRRLWLSFEAFDFDRQDDLAPHLRFTTRWQVHPNLYLLGGYDDFLENDSLFLGGGIRWDDDNLKYLLGAVPLR